MIMAIIAIKDYTVKQFDVKGAFLNGILEEDIYLKCPDGYWELTGKEERSGVCLKLNKALYGLKQAARQWFLALKELVLRIGMKQSKTVTCYVDADFAGCRETRRSTTGYVIMLGGRAIDWRSKKPFGILKMNEFKKSIGIVSIEEKKGIESNAAGLTANGLKTYSQVLQGGVLDIWLSVL
jgi:hypothetical protein